MGDATREKPARHMLSGRVVRDIVLGLGLACAFAWFSALFFNIQVFLVVVNVTGVTGALDYEQLLDLSYVTALLGFIVVCVLMGYRRRADAGPLLSSRRCLVLVGCGIVSTLCLVASSAAGAAGFLLAALGALIAGGCLAVLLFAWGQAWCLLEFSDLLYATAMAFALKEIVKTVLIGLNGIGLTVVVCLLPAVSLLALMWARPGSDDKARSQREELMRVPVFPSDVERGHYLRTLTIRLCICMMLWGAVFEFLRVLYNGMGHTMIDQDTFILAQGMAAAVCAVIMLVIIFAASRFPRQFSLVYYYRAILILTIAGIGSYPLMAFGVSSAVPYSINVGAFQAFDAIAWIVTIVLCQYFVDQRVRLFCTTRIAWAAACLAGFVIGRSLNDMINASTALISYSATVATLIVVCCYVCALTEPVVGSLTKLIPDERHGHFQRKCELLAVRYGLTEREAEVMQLLAKGRNVNYIREQLVLSRATVCSHRQHIYQKMGVHSSQELLNLVEKTTIVDTDE